MTTHSAGSATDRIPPGEARHWGLWADPYAPSAAEAGEQAAIDAIVSAAYNPVNGDDAAVLTPRAYSSRTVCSKDLLVRDRHFRTDWSYPEEVGHRAVVQNFADIEAMGARPTAVLLGLVVPPDLPISALSRLGRGIHAECQRWAAGLVGGDIVTGQELVISVTAVGELGGPDPELTLSGARPGDTVIMSGRLGYSAAGLALMEAYGERENVPGLEHVSTAVEAYLTPPLEVRRGTVARAAGAHCLTDNSDGMMVELATISQRSGVALDLDSSAIAPDDCLRSIAALLGADPWEWIYQGGEDHSLIGTTPTDPPSGFRPIGRVYELGDDSAPKVTVDGAPTSYHGGWQAFSPAGHPTERHSGTSRGTGQSFTAGGAFPT